MVVVAIAEVGMAGVGYGHKAENRVPLWSWALERVQGQEPCGAGIAYEVSRNSMIEKTEVNASGDEWAQEGVDPLEIAFVRNA